MPLLSTSVAAERVHVSSQAIRDWIRRGDIKGIRIGRNYKVPASEIDRLLADLDLPESA